jgi:rubredoxin
MREIVRIKSASNSAWACSACAWLFNATGPPQGNSIEEMTENFERQRDQAFAAHICAQHPTGPRPADSFAKRSKH